MEVFKVDLYEYFNIQKDEGKRGILTCYLKERSFDDSTIVHYYPAMLVVAGGAYCNVSKREAEPVALKYLSKGYNAFTLNYSVDPNRFPTSLIEICMAMVYIRMNAKKLGVNKESVGAIGFSAGGHLVGTLATMYNHKAVEFLKVYNEEIKPNAVVFGYPVISGVDKGHEYSFMCLLGERFEELKEEFSIDKRVNKDTPPAFIFSTFDDNCVPCKNSLLLAMAYENSGVPFALHVFGKGTHGLSVGDKTVYNDEPYYESLKIEETTSKDFTTWFDMSINFLEERGFKRIEEKI